MLVKVHAEARSAGRGLSSFAMSFMQKLPIFPPAPPPSRRRIRAKPTMPFWICWKSMELLKLPARASQAFKGGSAISAWIAKKKMNQVKIFDTTLRDGEQSPGASHEPERKAQSSTPAGAPESGCYRGQDLLCGAPRRLSNLFQRIAQEVRGVIIASLARTVQKDIDAAASGPKGRGESAHPCLFGNFPAAHAI